ncbi:hypothetical protein KM043_005591 [Ampulex compressa]|nr:hypothetical protein KM043_005591 [Ampulex compressa]
MHISLLRRKTVRRSSGFKGPKPSLHSNVNVEPSEGAARRQVRHCTCAASTNPAKFDRFHRERRNFSEHSDVIAAGGKVGGRRFAEAPNRSGPRNRVVS